MPKPTDLPLLGGCFDAQLHPNFQVVDQEGLSKTSATEVVNVDPAAPRATRRAAARCGTAAGTSRPDAARTRPGGRKYVIHLHKMRRTAAAGTYLDEVLDGDAVG